MLDDLTGFCCQSNLSVTLNPLCESRRILDENRNGLLGFTFNKDPCTWSGNCVSHASTIGSTIRVLRHTLIHLTSLELARNATVVHLLIPQASHVLLEHGQAVSLVKCPFSYSSLVGHYPQMRANTFGQKQLISCIHLQIDFGGNGLATKHSI